MTEKRILPAFLLCFFLGSLGSIGSTSEKSELAYCS